MFEQFVSDLLVRYLHLDDYIEGSMIEMINYSGIDSNHLNIALWNGMNLFKFVVNDFRRCYTRESQTSQRVPQ